MQQQQECTFGRCDGSGWLRVVTGNVERTVRCDCFRAKRSKFADGVPVGFDAARLENYRDRQGNALALAAAREWLEGKRSDLYLWGGVGSGKTRLACSLLNEAHARGQGAYFVRVPFLMLLQLQGMDDPEKKAEANAILDKCMKADPIVLDDIAGAENASDFSRRVIVTLYDQRIDHGLRTIWTSNVNLQGLMTYYGDDRLPSRIAGAVGETIELTCEDFRLEGNRY
jgi:DNA replication protein DnaC